MKFEVEVSQMGLILKQKLRPILLKPKLIVYMSRAQKRQKGSKWGQKKRRRKKWDNTSTTEVDSPYEWVKKFYLADPKPKLTVET